MIWSKEETLSRVEMEKLQLSRLQETVKRVYEKVPYYRAKMQEKGLKPEDIQTLRFKKNGGRRLLIAAMNVSETTPRDYFWNSRWKIGNPSWLARPSLVDADGVITEYWNENWRKR